MLEGKNVNLRIVEKEDVSLVIEWVNNPEFYGLYNPLQQTSKTELEKRFENLPPEEKTFFIEKKDGSKLGGISHYLAGNQWEIGYTMIPTERRKGYCTEAVEIMVDYLFLSKEIVRIQAHTDVRNVASQKVLEHAGFKKEGLIRKHSFVRGEWRLVPLQYPKRRMERTKDTNKNPLRIISFWFCGKVIAEPRELTIIAD